MKGNFAVDVLDRHLDVEEFGADHQKESFGEDRVRVALIEKMTERRNSAAVIMMVVHEYSLLKFQIFRTRLLHAR